MTKSFLLYNILLSQTVPSNCFKFCNKEFNLEVAGLLYKQFIKEGNKKHQVKRIYSEYNPKIKDITKNTDLEQKKIFYQHTKREKIFH